MMNRPYSGRARELRIACWQHEGATTEVWLDLEASDDVGITSETTGTSTRGQWRDEHGIQITAGNAPRLAYLLIADHYAGDADAIGRLRELARRGGVEVEEWDFQNGRGL